MGLDAIDSKLISDFSVLLASADSTCKCNRRVYPKEYLIWCFIAKTFSGAII